MAIEQIDENLFCATQPLRFLGAQVGTRMTVIRLAGKELLVHSPIALSDELRGEVEALGAVRYLVAPNRYHHLFVGHWLAAYPEAMAYAAPGLAEKRKDVAFAATLTDGDGPWAPEVQHALWQGAPQMNEVHFLHRPTRTLILADSAHNFGAHRPLSTRLLFGLLGGSTGFRTTLVDKMTTRDRELARASLERLLRWDFDRVVVAHGDILERGGPESMRAAYAWLT
ncbi:MAG TPA: DUF4336 domain-containing protein [Kofleriaceae bacterium]|nr:DUF4336 domain-containing protein [Kofleriaceae bacterium]